MQSLRVILICIFSRAKNVDHIKTYSESICTSVQNSWATLSLGCFLGCLISRVLCKVYILNSCQVYSWEGFFSHSVGLFYEVPLLVPGFLFEWSKSRYSGSLRLGLCLGAFPLVSHLALASSLPRSFGVCVPASLLMCTHGLLSTVGCRCHFFLQWVAFGNYRLHFVSLGKGCISKGKVWYL